MAETSAPDDILKLIAFKHPLPNRARCLKQRNTWIVAFESSSTAGNHLVVPPSITMMTPTSHSKKFSPPLRRGWRAWAAAATA